MLSGWCYELHCMYWEMILSRSILRGDKLSVDWIMLWIALHVEGDEIE